MSYCSSGTPRLEQCYRTAQRTTLNAILDSSTRVAPSGSKHDAGDVCTAVTVCRRWIDCFFLMIFIVCCIKSVQEEPSAYRLCVLYSDATTFYIFRYLFNRWMVARRNTSNSASGLVALWRRSDDDYPRWLFAEETICEDW